MSMLVVRLRGLAAGMRHPAVLIFLGLWIASTLAIAMFGGLDVVYQRLPFVAAFFLLGIIILLITPANPPESTLEAGQRQRLWLQTGFILLIILITGLEGLIFHGLIAEDSPWAFFYGLRSLLGFYTNIVWYFVVPLPVLLLMGADWRELGFGRGKQVWFVLGVSAGLLCLPLLFGILPWPVSLSGFGQELWSNFVQNGFFEEFLFRGAMQTRLRKLTSPVTSVVVSSLVFGLWHLGLGYSDAGSIPGSMAICIFSTAVFGLVFGILMERTRNLVAPSVVHVLINSIG